MRVSALQGQSRGSLVAVWLICSPRTAFFWSLNVSVAFDTVSMFKSFKEESEATNRWPAMVNETSQRRKA